MASVINTNLLSLNAQRNTSTTQSSLATSLQRLSSGLRVNSAKDDAAGLAISERLSAQVRGGNVAIRNANDGISLSQTAEGALGSSANILQRVRELAVQSANATNSASDRQALQAEVTQLTSELDRISTTTQFNGQNLLDGTFGTANFQVGANANQVITASTANFRTNTYGDNQIKALSANAGSYGVETKSDDWGKNAVAAGKITLSGLQGTKTVDVAANATAKGVAQTINDVSAVTGVNATAETQVAVTFDKEGSYSFKLKSDNTDDVTVNFSLSAATGSASLSSAMDAINAQAGKTGITATLNSDGTAVVLKNATGNDIRVAGTGTATADIAHVQKLDAEGKEVGTKQDLAKDGSGKTISSGYLLLNSQAAFSVTADTTDIMASATSTLKSVSSLDISTFAGATDAIRIVDSALATVNGQRAKFGALQSRFETAIANLQVASENTAASRSRIQDADFASETASLSRAQVLQQASTAMIAQANQLPQQVLQLLR